RLAAVLDDDGVAVGGAVTGAVAAGLDDGAAVGGDDRGAGRDGVVLAGVLGGPHAAVLGEARGQLVALHRRDPGRLLLRGGLGGLRGLVGRDGLRLRGLGLRGGLRLDGGGGAGRGRALGGGDRDPGSQDGRGAQSGGQDGRTGAGGGRTGETGHDALEHRNLMGEGTGDAIRRNGSVPRWLFLGSPALAKAAKV